MRSFTGYLKDAYAASWLEAKQSKKRKHKVKEKERSDVDNLRNDHVGLEAIARASVSTWCLGWRIHFFLLEMAKTAYEICEGWHSLIY